MPTIIIYYWNHHHHYHHHHHRHRHRYHCAVEFTNPIIYSQVPAFGSKLSMCLDQLISVTESTNPNVNMNMMVVTAMAMVAES